MSEMHVQWDYADMCGADTLSLGHAPIQLAAEAARSRKLAIPEA